MSHPPKQVCFMCFIVTYPMPRARHLPKATLTVRESPHGAFLQPSVRNPSIECGTCNTQSLGQILFAEQTTARMRREEHLVSVCCQPMVEMANNPIDVFQRRFIVLVCPHANGRRIEVRKLWSRAQLFNQRFETHQLGSLNFYFATAGHRNKFAFPSFEYFLRRRGG